ncbi:transcriptional regulator with XRE-family HTH domain [Streptomyces sp. SAI-135]|uniref:helix-turn-helix domain-containing protein n=1 Tax=unclassified Streptomyces TaxID=2593676 RepID=UPI0024733872|nr:MULTISPECIES: helix-turn-helix domain-containing protein [unclassified Streptomyces]MDH6523129.1 transcriptional regulator with XRE-family HTH domain [Streptomyces sp. SAI-090]MDH6554742.1 transcriptional regulator with XRE-family HTH domain [Streptomyces sp. SAI-041]MDH6574014.1 transcriptional regulator with XRE-family HTH domain [Streptomyces sp. SAI-117]MDH6581250.1 transcriptional regulator with XRE-family HTH domain [Streptomyces sp. SAI-133]MDH6613257.1 transcriptional regulator with
MTTENAVVSEGPDLATMLRSWRARVRPEDVSSPFARGARRTPGLRREEVGWLAGVSPDYVKRLEQGRAHPSADVLRALSRALRLTDAEFKLACRLAGHAAELDGTVPQLIGPSVQRLLGRLADVPIAVFDAAWTLLEYNDLWAALHGETRRRAGRETNLVWRTFHNDPGRVRHPSPEDYRASLVADLRDVASRYPADRRLVAMISDLRRSNTDFARLWDGSAVAHHASERKTIDHPQVGAIELDCDVLSLHGADLRVIVFTAAPDSEAADKLRLLTVIGLQDMASSAPSSPAHTKDRGPGTD